MTSQHWHRRIVRPALLAAGDQPATLLELLLTHARQNPCAWDALNAAIADLAEMQREQSTVTMTDLAQTEALANLSKIVAERAEFTK